MSYSQRRTSRRIAGLGVAVALAATLAACSSDGEATPDDGTTPGGNGNGNGGGEDITIGLAVPNQQSPFFVAIREWVENEAEAEGVEVVFADAKNDADTQVSQVQDFITQQVDALIYIPAGATAATVPVREANAAGVPVVTVDRNPDGAPGDTFIATDSTAAARELGEWLVEQTGGEGNLGIIQGQLGTTPEEARDQGFSEGIAGSNIVEIARQASDAWAQDEGYDIATDMLQAHPEINIIFGRADGLALGAAQAARNGGFDDVMVIGFDGDPSGLQAVADGQLAATVTQQTTLMGKLALQSALQLIAGEELPAEQLQEGILTTPENVEEFLAEHP